jgi:hypothetical protein
MTYIATLIAAIVALISIQQYLLARERFKLDLFEKRFSVFKATETFLNDAIRDHHISWENLQKFDRDTQTASFLFDEDIVGFLTEIRTKANIATTCYKQQEDCEPGSPERLDLGKRKAEILEEFISIQGALKDRFSRYLKFRNWKYEFLSGISN